jgi:hypothetical protein|tara:strand:- start:2212 stop:4830 length:2619 start_codon:yes stop_codon:yes gene_type:complete
MSKYILKPQNFKERLAANGEGSLDAAKAFVQSTNISTDGILDSVTGSVQDTMGATVNLSNSLNGLTGPSILSQGFMENIKGGVSDMLGGKFGGFLGAGIYGSGKLPNDLEQFASFTYSFTLGCLSENELQFPDQTYRRKEPEVIILRSGGGPTPGSSTLYESAGKVEYFIDDVEIETIIAGNEGTRATNATSISFKVTEPYSMGLFLQALQVAAKRAQGPLSSYIEAPYLLTVDFKGYDDTGKYIHASNLRRMFPLKFVDIQFDVTEGGSEYSVQAIPYHEIALTDQVQTTHSDVSFAGSTVAEMLQTGEKSLTRILNDRELALEAAKKVEKANQYVIMFPTSSSSAQESSQFMKGAPEQTGDDSATTREFTDEEIKKFYVSATGDTTGKVPVDYAAEIANAAGISVKRSAIGENIREYAEQLGTMNSIGKSKITKANTDGGARPMQSYTNAESEFTQGEIDCCRVQLTGDVRQGTFSSGKRIQTIIEEIIITSEYGRDVSTKKPDGNGMIPWFRIETQVYNADSSPNVVSKTGMPSRIFVYRVIPYLVHLSKFIAPSEGSPSIPQLKQQAAKEYNYIYTGLNKDIIDFDIKFNTAFFASIGGDMGQAGADSKTSVVQETTATGEKASPGVAPGNESANEVGRMMSKVALPNLIDGGVGLISPESQIARDFNEALMNSPVDLIMVDLTILGDPYYIADSGMGNYNAEQMPGTLNVTSDGTINYQSSEVDIELNFRTPLDYGPDGYMQFPGGGSAPVSEFSGVYQVVFVNNTFSGGQFTQTLQTIRRPRQDDLGTPASELAVNTTVPDSQMTETNANEIVGSADDYGQGVAPTTSSRPAPLDGGIPVGTTKPGGKSQLRQRQEAKAQQQSGPF